MYCTYCVRDDAIAFFLGKKEDDDADDALNMETAITAWVWKG
jgi:hypothetical protein